MKDVDVATMVGLLRILVVDHGLPLADHERVRSFGSDPHPAGERLDDERREAGVCWGVQWPLASPAAAATQGHWVKIPKGQPGATTADQSTALRDWARLMAQPACKSGAAGVKVICAGFLNRSRTAHHDGVWPWPNELPTGQHVLAGGLGQVSGIPRFSGRMRPASLLGATDNQSPTFDGLDTAEAARDQMAPAQVQAS